MTAIWPASLPKPTRDEYARSELDTRLQRKPDRGPPGYRNRFGHPLKGIQLALVLDRNGLAEFERFHEVDTKLGTRPFMMPDAITHDWPITTIDDLPLLTAEGVPLLASAYDRVTFGDPQPRVAIIGVNFRVVFQIVVLP